MSITKRLYNILKSYIKLDKIDSKSYNSDFNNSDDFTSETFIDNKDKEIRKYYANLEIPYASNIETVTRAWKRLLKKYHPDLHSTDPDKLILAQELTKGINHAYEKIKESVLVQPPSP